MWWILLWACRSAPPSPVWEGHEKVVLGTGAGCTIVAIHGRGDSPSHFRRLYEGLEVNATVLVPRAPEEIRHQGYSWFPSLRTTPEAELADAIALQADRLVKALENPPVPVVGTPIVTGFSQGGMLSFTIAARHPKSVSHALPVGGMMPTPLRPSTPGPVQITAFHGEIDQIVAMRYAKDTIQAFDDAGWNATLHTYPRVAHQIPPAVKEPYWKALKRACEE